MHPLLFAPVHTPDALHAWIELFTGLRVPRKAVCPHHAAPFDYLLRAYFEPAADQIVWAPRGGGKTSLAAVATLLDLLHKPNCSVRILGGSLEQSLKMWESLLPHVERLARGGRVRARSGARRLRLTNGSNAAVLTQSQRAVRGLRVQKLRCDEVELFDPKIWSAAQLVTRSTGMLLRKPQDDAPTRGLILPDPASAHRSAFPPHAHDARHTHQTTPADPTIGRSRGQVSIRSGTRASTRDRQRVQPSVPIAGTIEALSTLHAPFGLMQQIVETAESLHRPVLRWCLLEVLEPCPPHRDCGTCPLFGDCQGMAKHKREGFVPIDDAIAMKRRVSAETWETEMLCRRPSVRGRVFGRFDPGVHVVETLPGGEGGSQIAGNLRPAGDGPSQGAGATSVVKPGAAEGVVGIDGAACVADTGPAEVSLAIDFGFANPFVCLWVSVDRYRRAHVMDEYVCSARPVHEHVAEIRRRPWPARHIACDPAGNGANDQTGRSNVELLRREGFVVVSSASRIVDGIELVRGALAPAVGPPTLFVHPRCTRLVRALQCYRYPDPPSEIPLKDGEHDHLIDALRYHFIARSRRGPVVVRRY